MPIAFYKVVPYLSERDGRFVWKDSKSEKFFTYALLKKSLKTLLENSEDEVVTVYRTRRGQFGEWFEKWTMENGKPKIYKEGWM